MLPDCRPERRSATAYYHDVLAISRLADSAGLDYVKMTEHYLGSYGGYCPSPLTFLAAVAAQTSRIRLMTGGHCCRRSTTRSNWPRTSPTSLATGSSCSWSHRSHTPWSRPCAAAAPVAGSPGASGRPATGDLPRPARAGPSLLEEGEGAHLRR
ncbi:LLM class flavin-dependent oxidoreductase [Streptomyces hawaiiensis]|uniref:LLM class flavin-dependent oxidoreductase n=1 Tax=Streptomyces hawaiiensis TaxID=67305 RepID=UPI00364EB1C6